MNKEEHKSFLLEIAKNVSKLLASNPANRDRFDRQVKAFCKMRDTFLQALTECQEAAKANPKLQCKKDEEKPPKRGLELERHYVLEISPKTKSELKDYKSDDFGRDSGVKRTMFWRPPLPFAPERWLQYCYGYYWREWLGPKPEEPENKNQQLTCQCAVLAVIYDKALGIPVCDRLTDSDPNGWAELLWVNIKAWRPITSQRQAYCAARRDRIQLALEHVKADLPPVAKEPPVASDVNENRVQWDPNDPNYCSNKEAIEKAKEVGREHDIDNLKHLDYDKLKKLLRRPGCTIKYMSRNSPPRGRVHKQDWQRYLHTQIEQAERFGTAVEQEVTKRLT